MARTHRRPAAPTQHYLATCRTLCWTCGAPMWVAYTKRRKLMTLTGLIGLHLPVRRCRNPACARYHQPYAQKPKVLMPCRMANLAST